ncbi:MAG: hypothetical protein IT280_10845 [Ignavibacteria bacterium]|nr:hypothetical protein [Ignavibacteria bacterium]
MTEKKIPKEVYSIITSNFELEERNVISIEDVHRALTFKIRELLDKNVEMLLSILYRIDVGQKITDEIFKNSSKEDIAIKLSDAIIERQLQKVLSRKKYRE